VEVDANLQLVERNEEEKERLANELRHLIGKIPRLQVFIDEVQRAALGDIKLRAVVNGWCRTGQISAVLGFSGTPYHDAPRTVQTGPVALQSATIANTVYYYPLATAIAGFLKKPRLEVAAGLAPIEIVRTGVTRFLRDYGCKTYANGACAKLAIYCGTIARLEEEVYPLLVGELGIAPERILKFHQGNKEHAIAKEAAAEFALLDDPSSRKQIVLLVQIGKEGWDCRSLTGVILSQEGDCPRNMVLQTSCRCLRQMDGGTDETAFILLNEPNAKVLDKQLGEEQNTSIQELNAIRALAPPPSVPRISRMEHLKLPPVVFYQLKVEFFAIATGSAPETAGCLAAIDPAAFKSNASVTTRYLNERHATDNQALGVVREVALVDEQTGGFASFSAWINEIVRESLGDLAPAALRPYRSHLQKLFDRITYAERGQRHWNTLFDQSAIRAGIRMTFHVHRELQSREEVIEKSASLLLVNQLNAIPLHALLWPDREKCGEILRADQDPVAKPIDSAVLEQKKRELEKTAADLGNPELAALWIRQLQDAASIRASSLAIKDRTLHYIPYDFRQSGFERKFIDSVLTLGDFKNTGLEIYYNGERHLTEFKIDCFARRGRTWRRVGFYTPDFLLIRRDANHAIRKVLIVETKGRGFADQVDFVARRNFMENDFIRLNNEKFGYQRFDFLLLRDDAAMPQNLALLAERIKNFFTEE
jgi:type III restriction enzyme